VAGECNHPTQPVKLSGNPSHIKRSPCLGEHNEYVYKKLLGLPDEEYSMMENEGVFE
jgi:crotonobetainyl-CoA:carnitine CoA-transferase CaiB-like acyl-CoA transferase